MAYGGLANAGVPMETALDSDGCEVVRDFLRTLNSFNNKYGKVNVGRFMLEYRALISGKMTSYKQGRGRKISVWTEEKIKQAAIMRNNGKTWREIGIEFGVNGSAAREKIKWFL